MGDTREALRMLLRGLGAPNSQAQAALQQVAEEMRARLDFLPAFIDVLRSLTNEGELFAGLVCLSALLRADPPRDEEESALLGQLGLQAMLQPQQQLRRAGLLLLAVFCEHPQGNESLVLQWVEEQLRGEASVAGLEVALLCAERVSKGVRSGFAAVQALRPRVVQVLHEAATEGPALVLETGLRLLMNFLHCSEEQVWVTELFPLLQFLAHAKGLVDKSLLASVLFCLLHIHHQVLTVHAAEAYLLVKVGLEGGEWAKAAMLFLREGLTSPKTTKVFRKIAYDDFPTLLRLLITQSQTDCVNFEGTPLLFSSTVEPEFDFFDSYNCAAEGFSARHFATRLIEELLRGADKEKLGILRTAVDAALTQGPSQAEVACLLIGISVRCSEKERLEEWYAACLALFEHGSELLRPTALWALTGIALTCSALLTPDLIAFLCRLAGEGKQLAPLAVRCVEELLVREGIAKFALEQLLCQCESAMSYTETTKRMELLLPLLAQAEQACGKPRCSGDSLIVRYLHLLRRAANISRSWDCCWLRTFLTFARRHAKLCRTDTFFADKLRLLLGVFLTENDDRGTEDCLLAMRLLGVHLGGVEAQLFSKLHELDLEAREAVCDLYLNVGEGTFSHKSHLLIVLSSDEENFESESIVMVLHSLLSEEVVASEEILRKSARPLLSASRIDFGLAYALTLLSLQLLPRSERVLPAILPSLLKPLAVTLLVRQQRHGDAVEPCRELERIVSQALEHRLSVEHIPPQNFSFFVELLSVCSEGTILMQWLRHNCPFYLQRVLRYNSPEAQRVFNL